MATFRLDGRRIEVQDGDTIGSAAFRAGVRTFSRSLKSHRRRGLYCGTGDCANCLVTVDGMPVAKTKDLVLNSWLSATGDGVTTSTTTLGGKEWEVIDYGDEGAKDYVRVDGDDVIVITSSDPAIAGETASSIK